MGISVIVIVYFGVSSFYLCCVVMWEGNKFLIMSVVKGGACVLFVSLS